MYSKEVLVPENVNIEIENKKVKVSGEKGSLEREFKTFFEIKIEKNENKLKVSSESERRKVKAEVGTIAGHIGNMIKGVTKGYIYRMRVVYSHFPVTLKIEGNKVLIQNFLGERSPRVAKIAGGTKVKVEKQDVTLTGIDKEDVGLTASNIEQATKIRGYDRKVFQDGCYIVSKE